MNIEGSNIIYRGFKCALAQLASAIDDLREEGEEGEGERP